VILISDEVPELIRNSNRILLMRSGRIQGEINSDAVSPDELQRIVEAA
jgi:ABC-type sugar transport system ATPase subunit